MAYFLCKLIPPRPTFPADMTEDEGAIMESHFGYWAALIEARRAVAYGPVLDPKGTYGIAVVNADDETAAQALADEDPAILSNAGFRSEVHPMPDAIVRP